MMKSLSKLIKRNYSQNLVVWEWGLSKHNNHSSKWYIWHIQGGGWQKLPFQSIKQRVIWYSNLSFELSEALCDYETHHSERFKDHKPCDMNEYIDTNAWERWLEWWTRDRRILRIVWGKCPCLWCYYLCHSLFSC